MTLDQSTFRSARREFLTRTASGFGMIAASSLLESTGVNAADSAAAKKSIDTGALNGGHFPGKAKRVIYLFQSGGPSHLDLFDPKPRLSQDNGKDIPKSILGTQRVTLMTRSQKRFAAFGSPFTFKQHGKSGQWFSSVLPHMAKTADDWCFIKSIQSEPINHDPAMTFLQTGRQIPGRPAMGSWLHYGLGSECEDLPAYIVMTSGVTQQPLLSRYWHNGFLPAKYRGVQFQSTGDPVLFLSNPTGINHENRGRILNAVGKLNALKKQQVGDPEIDARIDAFQMAYRMQTSVPKLIDFSDEPKHVLDTYGPDVQKQGTFAYQCLLARRLSEKGVRFVQLFHAGWDQHGGLKGGIERQAKAADQPTAALINDLKQRDMLKDTLIVWGGEFGRTAYTQGSNGRDHHPRCYTIGMAGGGIKGGVSYGSTDDYGYNIAENIVHVRDFHATLLHCLGIDHQRFTHKLQGLDAKLTGVEPARVVREVLA
ncbi:MAG: DUF1501 domain-containing protein [Planctomycetota bacterium]|nr:DUF1501 domain-containing protein [Planctomycetota bacterium]